MDAHDYRAGTLGHRLRRELEASPDFEDLMLLRELDDAGRVPGAVVGTRGRGARLPQGAGAQ